MGECSLPDSKFKLVHQIGHEHAVDIETEFHKARRERAL